MKKILLILPILLASTYSTSANYYINSLNEAIKTKQINYPASQAFFAICNPNKSNKAVCFAFSQLAIMQSLNLKKANITKLEKRIEDLNKADNTAASFNYTQYRIRSNIIKLKGEIEKTSTYNTAIFKNKYITLDNDKCSNYDYFLTKYRYKVLFQMANAALEYMKPYIN
jgi:hypothetical protein